MRKTILSLASAVALAAFAVAPAFAAGPTTVSGPIGTQPLHFGDKGPPVVTLQGDLWQFGYNPGPCNGFFGWQTRRALESFQKDQGLTVTGTLNGATFGAILKDGGWSAAWMGGTSSGGPSNQPGNAGGSSTSSGSGSTSSGSGSSSSAPSGKTIRMIATAYGPSAQDNYPYGAVDYFGRPLKAGDIAVDPRVIPLGSTLYICGYSFPGYLPSGCMYGTADDEGGAIKGNHIDIYVNAPDSVLNNFGIQNVTVTVVGSGN